VRDARSVVRDRRQGVLRSAPKRQSSTTVLLAARLPCARRTAPSRSRAPLDRDVAARAAVRPRSRSNACRRARRPAYERSRWFRRSTLCLDSMVPSNRPTARAGAPFPGLSRCSPGRRRRREPAQWRLVDPAGSSRATLNRRCDQPSSTSKSMRSSRSDDRSTQRRSSMARVHARVASGLLDRRSTPPRRRRARSRGGLSARNSPPAPRLA